MPVDFDQWLIYELNTRGISQAELARMAGVSNTAISDAISMKHPPGFKLCAAIADALGLSPEFVFRKAGLLPPVGVVNDSEHLDDFREILRHLTPEEVEELKRIGWVKINLKRESQSRKKP